MGGLIGTATSEKDGLLSRYQITDSLQIGGFSNDIIYKIANVNRKYSGLKMQGIETSYGIITNIFVYRDDRGIYAKGDFFAGLSLKVDSSFNVYIKVVMGRSYSTRVESLSSGIVLPITRVDSFPSDAVDISFT